MAKQMNKTQHRRGGRQKVEETTASTVPTGRRPPAAPAAPTAAPTAAERKHGQTATQQQTQTQTQVTGYPLCQATVANERDALE
jgi:hypothetical protein